MNRSGLFVALITTAVTVTTDARLMVRGGAIGDNNIGSWHGTPTRTRWQPPKPKEKPYFKVEEIVQPLDDYLDRSSRNVFVRRVYGLLSGSLVLSALSCLTFAKHPQMVAQLMNHALGKGLIGAGVGIGVLAPLFICFVPGLRHGRPAISLFTIFSIAEALMLGIASSTFHFETVVLALGQTLAATLALTAYGFQPNPRYDLTGFGSVLLSVLLVSMLSGVLRFIFNFPARPVLHSGLGALLFSVFIVYDTQLIVGGKKKKRQLDTRDYVLGAMMLYLDIANLFLRLLQLADSGDRTIGD